MRQWQTTDILAFVEVWPVFILHRRNDLITAVQDESLSTGDRFCQRHLITNICIKLTARIHFNFTHSYGSWEVVSWRGGFAGAFL
jgi:hypothetical protein